MHIRAYTSPSSLGVREGIEYKGRVLLTLQHRLSDDIQRESGGKGSAKHVLSTKGECVCVCVCVYLLECVFACACACACAFLLAPSSPNSMHV